jgi:hypothetical protein
LRLQHCIRPPNLLLRQREFVKCEITDTTIETPVIGRASHRNRLQLNIGHNEVALK